MYITEDRLADDNITYEKMQELRNRKSLTEVELKELDSLFRKYYIDNDDIRMYWQGR